MGWLNKYVSNEKIFCELNVSGRMLLLAHTPVPKPAVLLCVVQTFQQRVHVCIHLKWKYF